jgi:hypothetical protein
MSNPPGAPSRSASIANGPPSAGGPPAPGSAAPTPSTTPSQQNLNQIVCWNLFLTMLQHCSLITAPHATSRECSHRALFIFLSLLFFLSQQPLHLHISPITFALYSTPANYRVIISCEQSKWIRLVFQDRLDLLGPREARRLFQRCPAALSLLRHQRINPSRLATLQTNSYCRMPPRRIAFSLSI